MSTVTAALVSALASVTVTVISLLLADRHQRRAEQRAEHQAVNSRYLNPLRLHLEENHFRLAGTLERGRAPDDRNAAMRVIDDPAEVSTKDAAWFNSVGYPLVTSVYLTACLFAQLKQVRQDLPYLRLSGTDDTRLAALILGVQRGYLQDGGVYYVTQPSIGEDLWLRPDGRLRTYREFCDLLTDPDSRVWFDRLLRFHLQTARGERDGQAQHILTSLKALSEFLDQCVGGGRSISSRWATEGIQLARP